MQYLIIFQSWEGLPNVLQLRIFFYLTWNKLRDGGEMKEIVYGYLKNMAAFWTRIVRSDIADIFYFYDNLHFKYFFHEVLTLLKYSILGSASLLTRLINNLEFMKFNLKNCSWQL